jgi:integrase
MSENQNKGGRPRTGHLYWTKSGWRARIPVEIDGVVIKKSFDLETDNKSVARIKMKRLLQQQAPLEHLKQEAKRVETFKEAATRIVEKAKASGMATATERESRMKRYVFDVIGHLEVNKVRAAHIKDLLESLQDDLSQQSLTHIKNDISSVLGDLWRAEVLTENVCQRVQVPRVKAVKKERAVLTDEELAIYLAWQHPDENRRGAVLERQTMACVSRMFGGLRTGDLHRLRWDSLDIKDGGFTWGYAPRAKTKRPQKLAIPEMLRPILRDWWERQGRPSEGVIFPVRRGERAGKERAKKNSHAAAFRRDLQRAFGIEQPQQSVVMRRNQRRDTRVAWTTVRELTERERLLFEETDYTLPVDFHSWRRAYSQALADANVNEQQSMALAGHASAEAHYRYLKNSEKMRIIPESALPKGLAIRYAQTLATSSGNLRARKDSNLRPSAPECARLVSFKQLSAARSITDAAPEGSRMALISHECPIPIAKPAEPHSALITASLISSDPTWLQPQAANWGAWR